jgi:hypothetical protein
MCQHGIDDTDQFVRSSQYGHFIRQSLLSSFEIVNIEHITVVDHSGCHQPYDPLTGRGQIFPSIRTGNAINHMRVDCVGNTFTMHVNGAQLFSVTDNSLVNGDAGLMIGTSDEEDAVVLFDNFVVSKP